MARKQRRRSSTFSKTYSIPKSTDHKHKSSPPPPPPSPSQSDSVSFTKQPTLANSPSMVDSLKHGFGFGAGAEIARTAIRSVFPSQETSYIAEDSDRIKDECKVHLYDMITCMKDKETFECEDKIQTYKLCNAKTEKN